MFDFEIAYYFYKLSKIYSIFEKSKYKAKSFHSAALSLDAYDNYVEEVYSEGNLQQIPYVGKGIEKRICEIIETNSLRELQELEGKYEIHDYSLLLAHGLSDALTERLYHLNISDADELRNRIHDIEQDPGTFSQREIKKIRNFLDEYNRNRSYYLLSYGRCFSSEICGRLKQYGCTGIRTVGDVGNVRDRIQSIEIVFDESSTEIRKIAADPLFSSQKRYKVLKADDVNGFSGVTPLNIPFSVCKSGYKSETVFHENYWENQSVKILGDLHTHSDWSDGMHSIQQIAERAEKRGYVYQAITDHSVSMRVAHGMTESQALEQIQEIHEYNKTHKLKLLAGIEVDILADGQLDYSDEVLGCFDFVVAAIHSSLNQDCQTLIRRLTTALSNPHVNILAHPTGRLLGRPGALFSYREPYLDDVGMDEVIGLCRDNQVALEINCFPERLDICGRYAQKAAGAGVKVSLGTDSHSVAHMKNIEYGLAILEKYQISSEMILNCCSYDELLRIFAKKKTESTNSTDISRLKKDFYYYFGSNDDIINGRKSVIGIDLTGNEEKDSGWAYLKGTETICKRLGTNQELLDSIELYKPDIISIDSPLAYPKGRTNPDKDSPDAKYGIMRESERLLRHFGVTVYPCLIDSMINLTTRGMNLARTLRKRGYSVIESYPGAAQDILQIPRKGKTKEQFAHLKKGLISFGITGNLINKKDISHDEVDAITCALVGLFYLNGQYVGLGNQYEDYLIVPRIQDELLKKRIIIGFAGQSGAGKTTIAKYLSYKYGFGYFRYSKIIQEKYHVSTKQELQKIGEQISQNSTEQISLSKMMLDKMKPSRSYVIDGLRHMEDYETLKGELKDSFHLIYIDCSFANRFKRYRKQYHGEISREQFQTFDNHPAEKDIVMLRWMADERIENDSTYKALWKEIDEILKRYEKAGIVEYL